MKTVMRLKAAEIIIPMKSHHMHAVCLSVKNVSQL